MNADARRLVVALIFAPLASASPQPALAQSQVRTDFRVESASITRHLPQWSETLRLPVANLIAKAGQEAFPYLTWKTVQETAASGARLIVALQEGTGPCKPNQITLNLLAVSDAGEVSISQKEFIPLCDRANLDSPEETYLSKLSGAISALFADPGVQGKIQEQLLAKIVLTTQIDPDVQNKQLFLPIKPQVLRAGLGSKLVAFYGEQGANGSLSLQPRSLTGERTLVFLRSFRCGADVDVSQPEDQDGKQWPEDFTRFLSACTDTPQVFMNRYEPAGLPPIASDPGGGGQ